MLLMILFIFIYVSFQHDFIYNKKYFQSAGVITFAFTLPIFAILFYQSFKKIVSLLHPFEIYRISIRSILFASLIFMILFFNFLIVFPRYMTLFFGSNEEMVTQAYLHYDTSKECSYQLKIKNLSGQEFYHFCVSEEFFDNPPKPLYVKMKIKMTDVGILVENIIIQKVVYRHF